MNNNFYVYEHWRPDTNVCFYVGKGRNARARIMARNNKHHRNIQAVLTVGGLAVNVRIISDNLDEDVAFELEKNRIAHWRTLGVELVNRTDGGDGPSGNKFRLGAILSNETKKKIGDSHRGKPLTEEHKRAVAQALMGDKNPFFGKKHTPEVRAKVADANRRRVWSEEARQKMSEAMTGRPRKARKIGWKLSEETRRRQSEGMRLSRARKREALAAQSA